MLLLDIAVVFGIIPNRVVDLFRTVWSGYSRLCGFAIPLVWLGYSKLCGFLGLDEYIHPVLF